MSVQTLLALFHTILWELRHPSALHALTWSLPSLSQAGTTATTPAKLQAETLDSAGGFWPVTFTFRQRKNDMVARVVQGNSLYGFWTKLAINAVRWWMVLLLFFTWNKFVIADSKAFLLIVEFYFFQKNELLLCVSCVWQYNRKIWEIEWHLLT